MSFSKTLGTIAKLFTVSLAIVHPVVITRYMGEKTRETINMDVDKYRTVTTYKYKMYGRDWIYTKTYTRTNLDYTYDVQFNSRPKSRST